MKTNHKIFVLLIAALTVVVSASAGTYHYETVKGDPMHSRIYTLKNGLKVYLSVNKEKPRIQTYIAVKTGSRNDPKETTGLAHYLEHLMFKGTTHFGSSNVKAEAPLLDEIEQRFEAYRLITDAAQRRKAYHEIDSVSQLAAKYNIPNEYDKMMASIGSEGSNAYTSNDVTCYQEDIPSNEVDTWAKVQADRFKNMVIRGFHTELEAVYEEYNIGLSSDFRKEWDALGKKLFPNHPYGTQTTIGTQAHLKNPSITNIKNYFHQYYVPNNVAICMAGDFDPDQVIATIDKYFGDWKASDGVHAPQYAPVKALTAPVDTAVVGLEAENVMMGWRTAAGNSLQIDTLNVISQMLSNGKAGMFDIDLNTPMKVMSAGCESNPMHDYGIFILYGVPKQGQRLDEVRKLLIDEIIKLKHGFFSDDLLPSVVNNMKLDYYQSLRSNEARADRFVNAFINDESWKEKVESIDRISNMTKDQIVAFAKNFFRDNYVTVYKQQGQDTTIHKIDKPEITPIPTNNDKQSEFLKEVVNSTPTPIQPKFADYKHDLTVGRTSRGLDFLYKQNTDDHIFSLTYRYPLGSENDKRFSIAEDYLSYVGTDKMTNEEIKQKFYKLACDYNIDVNANTINITLTGLNTFMNDAVNLLEQVVTNAKADTASYHKYVDIVLKNRADNKTNQRANYSVLCDYGKYGTYNANLNTMSEEELRQANPQELLNLIANLRQYKHTLLYYGSASMKEVNKLVSNVHHTPKTLAAVPAGKPYLLQSTPTNEVLIAPYDAKNIYMQMYHNEGLKFSPKNAAIEALFNEYFCSGMNAVVFQEMREARGLAYSAGANYRRPYTHPYRDTESFVTTVITQNDKMMDCINEFNNLLNDMPQREAGFKLAKQTLMKSLATTRTTRDDVLWSYLQAKRLGIDYDLNSRIYREIPSLTMQDLIDFARTHIANKPYRYLILGDEKNLDMEALGKIGPIKRLSTEEIFGY